MLESDGVVERVKQVMIGLDRKAYCALRTSSALSDGRFARALLNCRKSRSRLNCSRRSRTARRINSAMMALLFSSPKALSNAALTSSGTLKLTVAMTESVSIVEIFNNEYTPVVSSVNRDFEGVWSILMSFAAGAPMLDR